MNSDNIFLCAYWSFAYDWKGEKYPGKLGMCQMYFLTKVTWTQGWGKPGHCGLTAQKLEDMKRTVYGWVFSSARCKEDFN